MAAEIFKGGNLRLILDTETDADSPISETLMNAIRYYSENILILGWSTGVTGTVDSVSTATMTDAALGASVDEHNGRTLVMTSGSAKGNAYTIDDTTATTLVCTGDDLEADGVAAADNYEVFFDILVNVDGHDHDGINSRKIGAIEDDAVDQDAIADDAVGQAQLKASSSSAGTQSTTFASVTYPGGAYAFYRQIRSTDAGTTATIGEIGTNSTSAVSVVGLKIANASFWAYVHTTYVTASGDIHWIFLLKDKTGKTIGSYEAPDHPCFGNGARPALIPHPFLDYDPKIHDIVVINPTNDQVQQMITRRIPIVGGGYLTRKTLAENKYEVDGLRPERGIMDVFLDDFDIIENKDADWPDIPITVGLPTVQNGEIINDYRFKIGEKITPMRRVIEKPDYITPLGMRLKK